MPLLRLGSRGSALALAQSRMVAAELRHDGGFQVEIEVFKTTGDVRLEEPLSEIGGKGLFTAELDRALLDGSIDLAVHSLKDLPTSLDSGLAVAAIPVREDSRDVLVGPRDQSVSLVSLPRGARVGTSSLRRTALLRAFRPDLEVAPIRGNLDTRIRKVDDGLFHAIILAAAGMRRMGWTARIGEILDARSWLPAPGQGALGLVARSDDEAVRDALARLHHAPTGGAVTAERALLARLEGGCQIPVGALATPYEGRLRLWGSVSSPDGRQVVRADATGDASDAELLGVKVAESLLERGADSILAQLRKDLDADSVPVISPP